MERKQRRPTPYRDLSSVLRSVGAGASDLDSDEARARVVAALATFASGAVTRVQAERIERQVAIITCCDLGGQLHKVVAAELGVSMRTFYRERVAAFERLRRAIGAGEAGVPSPRTGPPPEAVMQRIERAWEQLSLGHPRDGIVRLEEVAASAPPAQRAVACARLSVARLMEHGDDRTGEVLTRAKRAQAVLGPGTASVIAEAEIAAAEAALAAWRGAFDRASSGYARVASEVLGHAPHAHGTLKLALLGRIDTLVTRGDVAHAFALGQEARERAAGPELDVALAECALVLGGDCAAAHHDALAAHAAAAATGNIVVAARALRVAAQARAALLDNAGGLAHLRAAIAFAQDQHAGHLGVRGVLDLASSFAELGEGETALGLIEGCGLDRSRDDVRGGVARAREAEAYLALEHYKEAIVRGREAVRILTRFDSRRLLGEAMLTFARASLGCGDSRASRAMAVRAAKLLRGASWPTRVSRALRLAGRRAAWREAPGQYRGLQAMRAG